MKKIYKFICILFITSILFSSLAGASTITGGANGTYTKTVSINTLNATIPFAVSGATSLYVAIDDPGTYTAFDESNISTYPDPSRWLFAWPLNGNALDISGNGRNGAVTGATSAAGRSGSSNTGYYLDGNNDYISVDYPDTTYPANTFFVGYKLNHTPTDSNHVVVDFRNPAGTGRTGIYEYENSFYVNNATSTTTLNSTTNQGWKYAFYPFTSGSINYVWLGNRYNLLYDYRGWMDVAGLYNGTLSADQRRVFSYGYQGITVAPYPTTARTPIRSSSQAVTPPSTITNVNIQSPTSVTKTVTLEANVHQNYTLVRDETNGTIRNIDTVFTAASNLTSCVLEYDIPTYDVENPALTTNATGASVEIQNGKLLIHTGTLTTGQSRYYNVEMDVTTGTPQIQVTDWNETNSSCMALLYLYNSSINYEWTVTLNDTTPGYYYSLVNVATGNSLAWVMADTNAVISLSGVSGDVVLRIVEQSDALEVLPTIYVSNWDVTNASCIGIISISNSTFDDIWSIVLNDTIAGQNYSIVNAETDQNIQYTIAGSTASFSLDGMSGSILLKIMRITDVDVVEFIPYNLSITIKNDTIHQFKMVYNIPTNTTWLLDNTSIKTDNEVNASAYWFNASTIGIHNVTARINNSQTSWQVNVTSDLYPGSGDFVVVGIAVSVVVAAGYFWNKFRRRM